MVHLDHRDAQPIYSQIVASIRNQITAGVLQSGDKLPSVRDLASELAINPNTIQRAYRELEQLGLIETVPGKGCFVCQQKTEDSASLWAQFDAAAAALKTLGISQEELITRLKGEHHD